MPILHNHWFIVGVVFLVNLPFGFWRAGTRRFSSPWFVSIHLPVILSVGIRILAGIRFVLSSVPLFVAAFFLGQTVGGRFRHLVLARAAIGAADAADVSDSAD
jgi:hypothetical protein